MHGYIIHKFFKFRIAIKAGEMQNQLVSKALNICWLD